jgi:hypothetical protein
MRSSSELLSNGSAMMSSALRLFALKRENVSQEGFNALVHRFPHYAGPERDGL